MNAARGPERARPEAGILAATFAKGLPRRVRSVGEERNRSSGLPGDDEAVRRGPGFPGYPSNQRSISAAASLAWVGFAPV